MERRTASPVDVRKRDQMARQRDRAVSGQQNRIKSLERQIVRKCEQGQLNLDLVDGERIALVRVKEDENPVSQRRVGTRKTGAGTEEEEPMCDNLIPDAGTGQNKEKEKNEK
jgi:hypothetical protein